MEIIYLVFYLLNICVHFYLITGACPNSCSGHGICSGSNTCQCYAGYNGGAADCSLRECPYGPAWADKAYSYDSAHANTECSNAGLCNRDSGLCECFYGFTGNACQREKCVNNCSGHGKCMTINDISIFDGPPYDPSISSAGYGTGVTYPYWDGGSVTICECDLGYDGPDCSLIMCPKGDDPLTTQYNSREFSLQVSTSHSQFSGYLGVQFLKGSFVLSLANPSSSDCIQALQVSRLFGYVGCTYSRPSPSEIAYDIVIYSWPISPSENNLFKNDGDPSIDSFYCDILATDPSVTCKFIDIVNSDIPEYIYCSNRGSCDFSTGFCSCDDGFGGPACSNITYNYPTNSNSLPGMQVQVTEIDYKGIALEITSMKSSSPDFYLLKATTNENQMFAIRGDGLVSINRLETLVGGHTISGGGLFVTSGGCTIVGSPLKVYTSTAIAREVATFESQSNANLNSSYSVVNIISQSSSTNHFLLSAINQNTLRFAVRADGNVFINSGGLSVANGLTIQSNGLRILNGGLTISGLNGLNIQNGLAINNGGLQVTSGLTIFSNGMKIMSGGGQVYGGGLSIYAGGLKVYGGGLSLLSSGIAVTGGISVNTNGIRVTQGITVYSNGLNIVSGGMTVTSNGLIVTGGISVNNIGINSGAGMTITNGGLIVSNSGVSVSGGMIVTSGVTIRSNGLNIEDGLTVNTGGIYVSNGLTVHQNGLVIDNGGLSVTSGGLVSNQGITVTGVGVLNSGLSLAGGATISGSINAITSDMTINNLFVNGGITVFSGTPVSSTVSSWSVSDRRLKTNITPLNDALNKISKLRGVYYDWIQDDKHIMILDDKRHIGLLAQDVQHVIPEAVGELPQDNKFLGVNYNEIIPFVIEAIKEIKDKQDLCSTDMYDINKMKNEMLELKGENDELKRRLDIIEKYIKTNSKNS